MHVRSNHVVHLEFHTGALARARAFYSELVGWRSEQIDTSHGSYLALALGAGLDGEIGLGGGIVECPTERPLWLTYVEVADVGQATAGARLLGASVLLEPHEDPPGWRSVAATRWDGEIAFWQQKR